MLQTQIHKIAFFILCTVFVSPAQAQYTKKKSGNGTRLQIGPVVSLYTINTKHAINPQQKMSALFGFKREQRLDREYRSFLLIGIDYSLQGINFDSYYFSPDTLQLYDKSFAFQYSLYMHELSLPIQFKYLMKRADNSLFSSYVIAGYHLKYLLPANLKVSQYGNEILTDQVEMKYRTVFPVEQLSSALSVGFGWQKNSINSSKGNFFAELSVRFNFTSFYFETPYSASSLYMNATQLFFLIGLKF